VQSFATLVHNSRSSRPEVIVSVNYAIRYSRRRKTKTLFKWIYL